MRFFRALLSLSSVALLTIGLSGRLVSGQAAPASAAEECTSTAAEGPPPQTPSAASQDEARPEPQPPDGGTRRDAGAGARTAPGVTAPAKPTVPLQPPPAGFDTHARGTEVLAHLSSVIRFYRATAPTPQKVGEPSDALYHEQAVTDGQRIAQLAFAAGRAEAVLLQAYDKLSGVSEGARPEGEAQRLQAFRNTVAERINALKAEESQLDLRMRQARPKQRAAMAQDREEIEGQLALNQAIADSLSRITTSDAGSRGGLAGDIDRLQRTAPELAPTNQKTPVVPSSLENLESARSSGVTGQATVLFQLLGTRRELDARLRDVDTLHGQVNALRTPLIAVVRQLVSAGQQLAQNAPATAEGSNATAASNPAAGLLEERKTYESLTATFKVLSAATVPLGQELIALEQTRTNLVTWRTAVDAEYKTVLRSLLLRLLAIAIALGVVFAIGEVWRRGTVRYVHDLRRRRQLLVMRRVVVGFLSGLVVIFGVVSQFNSLATFAGFITAGLAVGLQTILLSVAAYFFIVGRYGVRVGDRVTIAGVTGDVVDVGLVRLYIMELGGGGNELHPTGRIAVFPNSVLFQAGTPLYKQMPGADYAWRELTLKLAPGANYSAVCNAVLHAIGSVYDTYKARIESQHRAVESWMDAAIDPPKIESRVQLADTGLQLWVRFPVELREASMIDQKMTESLVQLMRETPEVKDALESGPLIKAVVKS